MTWHFILTNLKALSPKVFLLRLVKIGPRVLEKRIICKVYENKNDDNNATTNTKKRTQFG